MRVTTTLESFRQTFPDESATRDWLERRRWPGGVECPHCGSLDMDESHGPWAYRCAAGHTFSLTSKTTFSALDIPVRSWLLAVLLFQERGLTPEEVATELGIPAQGARLLQHMIARGVIDGRERRPRATALIETFVNYALRHRGDTQEPEPVEHPHQNGEAGRAKPEKKARERQREYAAEPDALCPPALAHRLLDLQRAFLALARGEARGRRSGSRPRANE